MKIKDIHKLKLPYQYKIKGVNWILNRIVKKIENKLIRDSKICSCVKSGCYSEEVIVSMTTYPERLEKVIWTIKSVLNQSVPVDRFILWLAEEQYPEKKIPDELQEYLQYGLEIKFCDDIRSHKKYFYTMLENPDAIVITVDDDVIYPEDTVEKLLKMHQKFPDVVICNQGRLIKFFGDEFAPYAEWTVNIPRDMNYPSYWILPIGEGGVLYPSNSMDKEVFNKENIISMAFTADDLWLKFMCVKYGTKSMMTSDIQRAPCEVNVKEIHDIGLNKQNVFGGNNDKVIMNLKLNYKVVANRILNEKR